VKVSSTLGCCLEYEVDKNVASRAGCAGVAGGEGLKLAHLADVVCPQPHLDGQVPVVFYRELFGQRNGCDEASRYCVPEIECRYTSTHR